MTACELKPSRHSHGAVALLGVITFCVAALAQDPSGRMLSSSVLVFAAVREKGKPVPVNRAGGFLLDARHVMTNVKDCCAVTQKGQQPVPVVVAGKDSAVGKVIWSSQESETAILELDNPLGDAALTIAPTKLTRKGQDVYTVQYADSGPPKLGPGKLQDLVKVKDSNLPIYQTTAPMADGNSGGALFDACGNVIGVNLLVKDGIGYAVAIDPLLGALESAGLKATQAAKPCGGESAGHSSENQAD